jgi:hypothetical protein
MRPSVLLTFPKKLFHGSTPMIAEIVRVDKNPIQARMNGFRKDGLCSGNLCNKKR